MSDIPKDVRKVLEYLDKGMNFKEYCELISKDEEEVRVDIRDKVPWRTLDKINKVYFENEEEQVCAPPYVLRKFKSGRYGVFRGKEFKFMFEIPEEFIIKDTLHGGKYADIIENGGLKWVVEKVRCGWSIGEIAKHYGLNYHLLQKFIRLETGAESMHEFKGWVLGEYNGHLKCKDLCILDEY